MAILTSSSADADNADACKYTGPDPSKRWLPLNDGYGVSGADTTKEIGAMYLCYETQSVNPNDDSDGAKKVRFEDLYARSVESELDHCPRRPGAVKRP